MNKEEKEAIDGIPPGLLFVGSCIVAGLLVWWAVSASSQSGISQSPATSTPITTTATQSSASTNTSVPQPVAVPASPKKDLSSIIREWEPNVALVACYWNNNPSIDDQGSGFLTQFTDGTTAVVTNKHVIDDATYGGADYCNINLPNNSTTYTVQNVNMKASAPGGYDYGWLQLGLEAFIKNSDGSSVAATAAIKSTSQCSKVDDIGANVVVLGYPDYGGSSITATQGIISGFDGSYYTTSAAISAGNSGGVAIDPDKDCYLGIPSAVVYGKYGNLGRILSAKFIFSQ